VSGLIPQNFINDLIESADIVEIIGSRLELKKAGRNFQGLCPFHNEKTPSFSVSPEKQFFHCFGCKESGTVLTFLMKYENLDFVEAIEALAKHLGREVPRERGKHESAPEQTKELLALEAAVQIFKDNLRNSGDAISYLKSRGISGEIARDFGLGYAPDEWQHLSSKLEKNGFSVQVLINCGLITTSERGRHYDRFRGRITFPIRNIRGKTIGFGGRVFRDGTPKYLNSPETKLFSKSKEVYGLFEARRGNQRLDRLILVEGYMDVIALAQHGIRNSVATLGTAVGEDHFRRMYRYSREVVCCFDGDEAGRSAAFRALEAALPFLDEKKRIHFIFLPDGEDPDSFVNSNGYDRFQELVESSTPGFEYLFSRLGANLDLSLLDDKVALAGLARPLIDRVNAKLARDVLLARLGELTGLDLSKPPPRGGSKQIQVKRDFSQPVQKLSERLAGMLIRRPELLKLLSVEVREAFVALRNESDLLCKVEVIISRDPDLLPEELISRWPDAEDMDRVVAMANVEEVLEKEEQEVQFSEGIARWLDLRKENAEMEKLKQLINDGTETKTSK
jgi:DNA primase